MKKEEIFRLLGVSDEIELKSLLNCKSFEYADILVEIEKKVKLLFLGIIIG